MAVTQGPPLSDSTADMLDLFNVAKAALWMPLIPRDPPPPHPPLQPRFQSYLAEGG